MTMASERRRASRKRIGGARRTPYARPSLASFNSFMASRIAVVASDQRISTLLEWAPDDRAVLFFLITDHASVMRRRMGGRCTPLRVQQFGFCIYRQAQCVPNPLTEVCRAAREVVG